MNTEVYVEDIYIIKDIKYMVIQLCYNKNAIKIK